MMVLWLPANAEINARLGGSVKISAVIIYVDTVLPARKDVQITIQALAKGSLRVPTYAMVASYLRRVIMSRIIIMLHMPITLIRTLS